jgi:hypothetical protein
VCKTSQLQCSVAVSSLIVLIDKLIPFLQENLSFQTLHHFIPSLSTPLTYFRNEYLNPYMIGPFSSLLTSSTPDLVTVVLLLLILYISLRILDYARRVIMFWIFLILRLIFWGLVIGGGVYVYNVGAEKAVRDVGWLWGVFQGFAEDLAVSAMPDTANQPGHGRTYGYTSGYQRGGRGR